MDDRGVPAHGLVLVEDRLEHFVGDPDLVERGDGLFDRLSGYRGDAIAHMSNLVVKGNLIVGRGVGIGLAGRLVADPGSVLVVHHGVHAGHL